MKLVILAVVFAVLVVAKAEDKTCQKQEDCEENECCVDWFFFKGVCKPLGQEGDKCNNDFQLWGKYVHMCPCASGLDCEATETKDLGFATVKYDQRCVAEGSTAAPTATPSEAPEVTEAPTE